jgi:hypothetical protein
MTTASPRSSASTARSPRGRGRTDWSTRQPRTWHRRSGDADCRSRTRSSSMSSAGALASRPTARRIAPCRTSRNGQLVRLAVAVVH